MLQAAAFPYRFLNGSNGPVEVLLVTSRSKRWIIPKGDIPDGMTAHLAAEREAFEEGEVRGQFSDRAIGRFCHRKKQNGASIPTEIDVFPLEVLEELGRWPEMKSRNRRWFSIEEAANTVEDLDLAEMVRSFRR